MTDSTAGQNQRIADFIKRQVKAEVAGLLRAEIADLIRRQIKTEVAIAISPLQREITTLKEKFDELKAVVATSSQYEEEIHAYCSQVAASADIIQSIEAKVERLIVIQLMQLPRLEKNLSAHIGEVSRLKSVIDRIKAFDGYQSQRSRVDGADIAALLLDTQAKAFPDTSS